MVLHKKLNNTPCTRRSIGHVLPDPEKLPAGTSTKPSKKDADEALVAARERYATELEDKEKQEGLRDNPSVDPDTQRAIVHEYRALHQQIKDEGLYQCRYGEYAKESVRYAALFGLFLYLVHVEWYLTSSLALGLFWVRLLMISSKDC